MNTTVQVLIEETMNSQDSPENIGYRSETTWGYSTEGIRDIRQIMFHEMYEMHNLDIPDYCLDNYHFGKFKNRYIGDIIVDLLNEEIYLNEKYSENDAKKLIDKMLQDIYEQTGINCKYGLWLCNSKEDLINNYEADPENIQAYDTTNSVILSDLDDEGVLYGFENEPIPLN